MVKGGFLGRSGEGRYTPRTKKNRHRRFEVRDGDRSLLEEGTHSDIERCRKNLAVASNLNPGSVEVTLELN